MRLALAACWLLLATYAHSQVRPLASGAFTSSSRPAIAAYGNHLVVGIVFSDSLTLLEGGPVLRSRGLRDVAILAVTADSIRLMDHVGGPADDSLVALHRGPHGTTALLWAIGGTSQLRWVTVGQSTLGARGSGDVLVARYDSSDALSWARLEGASNADVPASLNVLPDGTCRIAYTWVDTTRVAAIAATARGAESSASILVLAANGTVDTAWHAQPLVVDDNQPALRAGPNGLATVRGRYVWGNAVIDGFPLPTLERSTIAVSIDGNGIPTNFVSTLACTDAPADATTSADTTVVVAVEPRSCSDGEDAVAISWRTLTSGGRLAATSGGPEPIVADLHPATQGVLLAGRATRSLRFDSLSGPANIVVSTPSGTDAFVALLFAHGGFQRGAVLNADAAVATSLAIDANGVVAIVVDSSRLSLWRPFSDVTSVAPRPPSESTNWTIHVQAGSTLDGEYDVWDITGRLIARGTRAVPATLLGHPAVFVSNHHRFIGFVH